MARSDIGICISFKINVSLWDCIKLRIGGKGIEAIVARVYEKIAAAADADAVRATTSKFVVHGDTVLNRQEKWNTQLST